MARKDAYHDIVKNALEKDGWTITSEPLRLVVDDVGVQIDLGAEQQPISAEKDGENIAVEIKSFVGPSIINELEKAIGQYLFFCFFASTAMRKNKLFVWCYIDGKTTRESVISCSSRNCL